jgi:hypothetical protein
MFSIFTYISIINLLIVIGVILIRKKTEKYNYEIIKTDDIKKGMILSFGTVLMFNKSKIKGLPKFTDESTDYRLTEEEVESIKKWKESKNGKEEITIVRHFPFAPFVLLGSVVFMSIKLFL